MLSEEKQAQFALRNGAGITQPYKPLLGPHKGNKQARQLNVPTPDHLGNTTFSKQSKLT